MVDPYARRDALCREYLAAQSKRRHKRAGEIAAQLKPLTTALLARELNALRKSRRLAA